MVCCELSELFIFTVKYMGSFAVDDCCLDEQMEQLHTQMQLLKVSLDPSEDS